MGIEGEWIKLAKDRVQYQTFGISAVVLPSPATRSLGYSLACVSRLHSASLLRLAIRIRLFGRNVK
jgi:hypothetical protein